MSTVADQLAARKAKAAKAKPQAKSDEEAPETEAASAENPAPKRKLTDKEREERKQAAFAKLHARALEKKAARRTEVEADLQRIRSELMPKGKPGRVMYSTRASYYGVKCIVQDVQLTQGRILVTVLCTTTRSGTELPEAKYYERRFSAKFLQEDPITEEYEPRRDGKRKDKFEAKKQREEKKKRTTKQPSDEEEAELDDEDLDLEEDDDNEVEVDNEVEDEVDEDEVDDEDEADDEVDDEVAEADEDSWG